MYKKMLMFEEKMLLFQFENRLVSVFVSFDEPLLGFWENDGNISCRYLKDLQLCFREKDEKGFVLEDN